jgi:hypothetical protein
MAFRALVAAIPSQALDLPSRNPAWTVREVLFHMSLAPRFMFADVRMIIAHRLLARFVSRFFPQRLFNWLNKVYTARRGQTLSPDALLEEYERGHRTAIRTLSLVSDGDLDETFIYPDWEPLLAGEITLERLFHYIKEHFQIHAQDLEQIVADSMKKEGTL